MSTYSIGAMLQPIERDIGWSRAQIRSGPALISLVAVCLSAFAGVVIDPVGARGIAIASTAPLCGALAAMSLATASLPPWWALWIMVGPATSAMPAVWMAPVVRRFTEGRGLAAAVALSGTGIGGMVVPTLAGYVIEHHGWRAAYATLSGAWVLVMLPAVILFFSRGHVAAAPNRAPGGDPAMPLRPAGVLVGALRTPAYRQLAVASLLTALVGTALVLTGVDDVAVGQLLLIEDGDRDRHVLQPLLHPSGGDDDVARGLLNGRWSTPRRHRARERTAADDRQ